MNRTEILLSDSRKLIYFDERPGLDRHFPDQRDLPPFAASSELRWDILTGRWVVIAGHRQERIHLPLESQCPLCPSTDSNLTEIPAPDYDVVVFENRFPAFNSEGAHIPEPSETAGLFTASGLASGTCEVICFTSEHRSSFSQLMPARARLIVEVWCDRTKELSVREEIQQVFCFENRGEEIGVTEPHPHGQVYAYPFLAPRMQQMITQMNEYRSESGHNLFDDLIRSEQLQGHRIVTESDHWISFVPFAPRWPYEIHLYPKRRVPYFPELSTSEKNDLALVYLDLLKRFDILFDEPAPYISAWHQYSNEDLLDEYALHLELFTIRRADHKLKYLAGSEAAMEVFIGDIIPEKAAQTLRELRPDFNPTQK